MGKLGSGNPLPFELGGSPSTVEKYNSALKQAVGVGGSAEDGTMEAQWRLSKARGLRAAYADDRAVMQWFPDRCTDFIPVWEEVFRLVSGPGLSDQERRQNITDRWVYAENSISQILEEALQRIDPLFSLLGLIPAYTATTVHGRGFEDTTPSDPDASGPPFEGGRSSTQVPNYSSDFVCHVLYAIGAGLPSTEQSRRMQRARDLLNLTLPSWVDFTITNNSVGFILDQDLLDLGAFGP
jgi:hypothetical protein